MPDPKRSTFSSLRPDLSVLSDSWPSPYVARSEVDRFTGGVITPRYMANLDSAGKGPEGRIKIGRKIAYKTKSLVKWIEDRAERLD